MMPNQIYAIILFFLVLICKLIYDYRRWKKSKPINHPWEATIVGIALIPVAIGFAIQLNWHIIFSLAYSYAMVGFAFWTLFDGLFNVIRRERWNFTGTIDKDDAKGDQLQRKLKWMWIWKIIRTGGLIIAYIKLV